MTSGTDGNSATFSAQFSTYIWPGAYSLAVLVFCLCLVAVFVYDRTTTYFSWNVILNLRSNYKQTYVYVIQICYFYRKTSIDPTQTNLLMQFSEVNEADKLNIRVPNKFFQYNEHNTFAYDYATAKFLLIRYANRYLQFQCSSLLLFRDTRIRNFSKVALTHDGRGGKFNISLVGIQYYDENSGFIFPLDEPIESMSLEEMGMNQSFEMLPQTNMDLNGELTILRDVPYFNLLIPMFAVLSLMYYFVSYRLVGILQDEGSFRTLMFHEW